MRLVGQADQNLVILVSLVPVVVHQLLDAGLDEADLGQDLLGGGSPDERLGSVFQRTT
jgi:hypothetical protein